MRLKYLLGIIKKYGVYSSECAAEMARTVKDKLKTDIAIGITGTTGNIDPNNPDSVQGQVYFCIIADGRENTFRFSSDVAGMTRHNIKQLYADRVFMELEKLI